MLQFVGILASNIKLITLLQVEPKLSRCTKENIQSHRRICCNTTLLIDNLKPIEFVFDDRLRAIVSLV